ncbi:MAG: aconitate hydratase AcnA [candidate division NC10 bacterium]|nr:aconitate hydratase AcnA [candidate division NC10 bacterium]
MKDPFGARDQFETGAGPASLYRLSALEKRGVAARLDRLPFSVRILLEAALRLCDDVQVKQEDVVRLARWNPHQVEQVEVPFKPARVLMQDFTGVPAMVDLAAMRSAAQRMGGGPGGIHPRLPVDLVIDHSLQVDCFGKAEAASCNEEWEFRRNRERYQFLRWAQRAFANFRVIPPGMGIIHQINLEFLAKVVEVRDGVAFPDTVVGTDSHTTMINGLGVLGWGVGGIEAEAILLGEPIWMLSPQVVGVRLSGHPREGATATDLVLTLVEALRRKGVVGKFVEFHGPALSQLSLPDRATLANMAPEYGATVGFFPIDQETLFYLRQTNRSQAEVQLVERYAKEQGLFRREGMADPEFSEILELDLAQVEPSLAGPKRPQELVRLSDVQSSFRRALIASGSPIRNAQSEISHGSVLIAALTSCTNTSHPGLMVAAGLLARKAVGKGLKVPPHVKTSLAPGSRVVTEYLREANLLPFLERLGFYLVGYGCTTCIGNSGPLSPEVSRAVMENGLVAASVLSGNRNFEGRIHPLIKANYLASPPLVVAYALAGTVNIDLSRDPVGIGRDGQPVFLSDLWPTQAEIDEVVKSAIRPERFGQVYENAFAKNPAWNAIRAAEGDLYPWDPDSTYIQEPPFFLNMPLEPAPLQPIRGARVLALLGDSVTTDHISPAGEIALDSPAGRYLMERGVAEADFNSYGSRRGNDQVMVRGTFANPRLKNLLVPGSEGGVTVHFPSFRGGGGRASEGGEILPIFEAAERYRREGIPLILIAGKEYGSGSSRDWAAKGVMLLGVKAILAQSFERIHRSNLVGMGVLPLQFQAGRNAQSLGLTGQELFDLEGMNDGIQPRQEVAVYARRPHGQMVTFSAMARLDTPVEVEYYRNGGILQTVLRKLLRQREESRV